MQDTIIRYPDAGVKDQRRSLVRLADRTDYALRVLMYLAVRGHQATVAEMAERFEVSHHHLVKVVQILEEAGLVTTTRGRGGGVALGVDPKRIRIGDVVRHTEPDVALAECLRPDGACPLHGPCRLTSLLEDARDAFFNTLNETTLADLARPRVTLLRALGESVKR